MMSKIQQQDDVTVDQCIEFAGALERKRAIKIIEEIMSLPIGGGDSPMPTAFHAGYQMACEEAIYRIENEVWELNLPPNNEPIGRV